MGQIAMVQFWMGGGRNFSPTLKLVPRCWRVPQNETKVGFALESLRLAGTEQRCEMRPRLCAAAAIR